MRSLVTRPSSSAPSWALALALALAAALALLAAAPAAANHTIPLTLKITKVECIEPCDEEGLEDELVDEDTPDFYAKAHVGGFWWTSPRAPDDRASVDVNWTNTWEVTEPAARTGRVDVGIQIWDHDLADDDLGDTSPDDADNTLDLIVNLADATVNGEGGSMCSEGDGGPNDEPSVRVCYEFDVGDSDGDGLLDRWETQGIDIDHDGRFELDLATRGAAPDRKDIFVELDYMTGHQPDPNAIADVVAAFAAAPVDAAGIALHVEEDEAIPHVNNIATWGGFDMTKAARFGTPAQRADADVIAAKRLVYRYSLWAHQRDGGNSSGRGELFGNDFMVTLGGPIWGANAAGTHNVGTRLEQSGTFMHELGHTLGLDHGGADAVNCKPNYVSVMNYTFQTSGIPQAGGGSRLDYSSSVRPIFVNKLDETALSEDLGIRGAVGNDMTLWSTPADNNPRSGRADGRLDWNGSGAIDPGTVTSDINDLAKLTSNAVAECGASMGETDLKGHNDWTAIDIKFRDNAHSADGTHGPSPVELTGEASQAIRALWAEAIAGPPVSLELAPATAENEAGDEHCVTASVRNGQGGPSSDVTVRFTVGGANSAQGAQATDGDGRSRFCYAGTRAGSDTITAYADTDDDAARDASEPGDEAANVYRPGPPASLALAPATATTTVDDEHCVTATVADRFGNATPAITVVVASDGANDRSGSVTTGADGTARFCYTGIFPGDDAISAFADTDADGARDSGEPGGAAANRYVLPPSTEGCKVTTGGSITTQGATRATFGGNVQVSGTPRGRVTYTDHRFANALDVKSIEILAVSCDSAASRARIFGEAEVNGRGTVVFRIDVRDNGEPGGSDTYRMRVNDAAGYDSGTQQLDGGNIELHR